jgi:hypothetical protein
MGVQLRTKQGRRTEFVGTIAGKGRNLHQESCRFRLAKVFADHSSLPFIESKVFSEKTGRRLVLTSHKGFREFQAARRTIQGYEAIHMIRKGQARWVAGDDLLRQIQFIDSLFDLAA